jgi:nicotinamidase-related amidase
MSKRALIIVDVQYDFLPPSGSLAVPQGEEILPIIKDLLDDQQHQFELVVASRVRIDPWG